MNNKSILLQLFLAICFAGTVFGAENSSKGRSLGAPAITMLTPGYSVKHSLTIEYDGVADITTGKIRPEFSQKTNLYENIIDGTIPRRIYPFDFTNSGDYVCYYLDFSHNSQSRVQLRDCATAEIIKLFPEEWKPEYAFLLLPRSPIISPDKKMIVFLGSKERNISLTDALFEPQKYSTPQCYLLFFDWENGDLLDFVKTAGTLYSFTSYRVTSVHFGGLRPSERRPIWPENKEYYRNNLMLFTPDSQKAIIRASGHQVDLYNLSTRLIERSFNLAQIIPGFTMNIYTFEWTEDNVLRINLHSNSDYPLRDSSVTQASFQGGLPYIDWNIETGEIVQDSRTSTNIEP